MWNFQDIAVWEGGQGVVAMTTSEEETGGGDAGLGLAVGAA